VLAGFYKHTLLAIPVTAILWLALHDIRRAVRAAIAGAAVIALGFVACWFMFGAQFFDELLSPRVYRLETALQGLGLLQWIAPALLIVTTWAWYQRQSDAARLVSLFAAIAFVVYFLQKLGDGVDDNAQFELVVAVAIGIGCAIHDVAAIPAARRWGIDYSRSVIVLILIARLLLSFRMSPYLVLASADFRQLLRNNALIVNVEIARIAATPGNVACSIVTVCRLAGKAFEVDAFNVYERILTGRLSPAEVDRLVQARGVRFERIDERAAHKRR
jgi:hypothetical protein